MLRSLVDSRSCACGYGFMRRIPRSRGPEFPRVRLRGARSRDTHILLLLLGAGRYGIQYAGYGSAPGIRPRAVSRGGGAEGSLHVRGER